MDVEIFRKSRTLSLNSILKLLILFSVMIVLEDIALIYYSACSDQIAVIFHFLRVVVDIIFFKWYNLTFGKLLDIKSVDMFLLIYSFLWELSLCF